MRSSCPITCALDLLGDRWTLVVLRDVVLGGTRHFSGIGRNEGIATNVLSERLARLEGAGVLLKDRDPDDGRRRIYRPTERGLALIPVLLELAIWGADHAGGTAKAELVEFARLDRTAAEAAIREAAG
jgi:DNA-binding HxlR family transcriptional regulator